MKIKLLILFLIFGFTQISYAQADKYGMLIETSLTGFLGWEGSHAGTHKITVGSKSISKGSNTEDETVVEYDFIYITDNPASIVCRGSTSGNKDGSDCEKNRTIAYNSETFDTSSFSGCIGSSNIRGIYLPQPVETTICEDKVISLTRGWNWEYSYDGINWVPFASQYQAKRNISFKLKDLTGYTGKLKLYIHTGFQTQFTSKIFYDIIPCSPNLVVAPTTQKTTCSYNNDGKVILTFDRKLVDNERFLFNFFKTPGDIIIATPSFTVDATNKIYTFSGLEKGQYYLKYQTFIGAQQTSVNNPPDPKFTIEVPEPLSFEIFDSQPLCNGEQGKVRIEAQGGTSPYYYTINNDPEIKFTTPVDNIILPYGNNFIKVRDENNCIDKEATDIKI